jgi:hypothetical protein
VRALRIPGAALAGSNVAARCRRRWVTIGSMRPIACAVLAACTTQHVGVTPRELLRHVPELRDQGHAIVEVPPYGTYELSADRTFDVTIGGRHRRMSIRDMVANCPDVPKFAEDTYRNPACLLENTTIAWFELDTRHRPTGGGAIVKAVGMAVAVVLVVGLVLTIGAAVCHASSDPC